jgi:hypothetical protein
MLLRAIVQKLEIEDDKIKYKTLENQFINLAPRSDK